MKAIKKLLKQVENNGFDGVYPLYIDVGGLWHEQYAVFAIEFEENNESLTKSFSKLLKKKFRDYKVYRRGSEFELIGPEFDEEDDAWYDQYPLLERWL